jgi:hypothetical protein
MQRLILRDDRVESEEALGYGFDRPPRSCNPDRLPIGISNGEIVARCGAPQRRDERYADQVQRDGRGNARVRMQRQEDWIYPSGSSRHYRLLSLVDGRLTRVQRIGR